ncbi:MAG TPA: CRTAC1 family protein [Verrucomicrobiae bacterium]|nr:CRTAC1 family protein [Verrucomicrobiae bacterium]
MTTVRGKALPILLVLLVLAGAAWLLARSKRSTSSERAGNVSPELVARFTALEAREKQAEETFWAAEIIAQECGRVFENLWDSLNATTNKLDLLATFPVGELLSGGWKRPQTLAHGIQLHEPDGRGEKLTPEEWRRFVDGFAGDGWQLAQIEFRHNRFDPDSAGRPKQSRFYFSAHLTNPARDERAALEGDLVVNWTGDRNQDRLPIIGRIDASQLTLKTRRGPPPFREILNAEIAPPDKSYFIDPLILYDLDGDGLSEIILAAKNLVFRRMEGDRYEPGPLCRHSPGLILTGLIADFDGDAAPDFLCARFEGLVLFRGAPRGTFDRPGEAVWSVSPHLKYAQVLTCGDIDRDGDLDVWLGQYKVPYDRGQMPAPLHDANDGHPAYLLLNDGRGHFTDATEAAGLAAKRWRRTYSASFADLDTDGDLDLMVVSDFAGVDLHANDGRGQFTDVTRQWVAEPHAFGMAHTRADFDGNGLLDVLMIGMNSPTADRLDHLNLTRDRVPDRATRRLLAHGNRLFLARPEGGFGQSPLGDSIARSGWAWGCSAFDFDNDGFEDIYIANGHESKQTVRDYEPEFWLHDIYVGGSKDDVLANAYFAAKFGRTRRQGQSYGGYEKNRFYLNRRGASFLEIGHLMGVALESDSRSVVADDLDGDGRMDLLVTTFEVWPQVKQVLHVYKNTLSAQGNWIGVRLREQDPGTSPVGAHVTVRSGRQAWVRQLATGDSYRSQHAATVHFGLANADRVESLEVRWPTAQSAILRGPELNRYHEVSPTKGE